MDRTRDSCVSEDYSHEDLYKTYGLSLFTTLESGTLVRHRASTSSSRLSLHPNSYGLERMPTHLTSFETFLHYHCSKLFTDQTGLWLEDHVPKVPRGLRISQNR